MERQEAKEESDDDNNAKAFHFVLESQKRKVKLGIEGCKKGESDKIVTKEKEKGVRGNGGFMRAEEGRQTEIEEKNRNNSWSSNTQKMKG